MLSIIHRSTGWPPWASFCSSVSFISSWHMVTPDLTMHDGQLLLYVHTDMPPHTLRQFSLPVSSQILPHRSFLSHPFKFIFIHQLHKRLVQSIFQIDHSQPQILSPLLSELSFLSLIHVLNICASTEPRAAIATNNSTSIFKSLLHQHPINYGVALY